MLLIGVQLPLRLEPLMKITEAAVHAWSEVSLISLYITGNIRVNSFFLRYISQHCAQL